MNYNGIGANVVVAGGIRFALGVFTGVAQSVRRRRLLNLTRGALHALTDDTLRDVGLSRCEIDYVAGRLVEEPGGLTLPQVRQKATTPRASARS